MFESLRTYIRQLFFISFLHGERGDDFLSSDRILWKNMDNIHLSTSNNRDIYMIS
jgi:hypothetical protein